MASCGLSQRSVMTLSPSTMGLRRPVAFQPVLPRTASHASRRPLVVLAAKKGGKGGKGGNKKGPGSLMDIPKKDSQQPSKTAAAPWMDTGVIMHNLLLIESHYRKVGRPILQDVEIAQAAKALWDAPFAVLAHDRGEGEGGPRFVYGNAAALGLFECTWDELIGTPSTRSAEDQDEIQSDRSQALAAAEERGCIEDYEGQRVSFKGRKFMIRRATLFNVEAPSGDRKGQACVIREWEFEDGTKGGEGVEPGAAGGAPPTPEELQAAEAAVEEQAGAVRRLKEEEGLGNADQQVKAAVAELLARKEALQQLQQRAEAAAAAAESAAAEAAAAEA